MKELREVINNYYNERNAENYDNNRRWRTYLKNTYDLALRLDEPRKGDIILDVPIGTGGLSCKLANLIGNSGRLYGVDLSGAMLKKAKDKLKYYDNVLLLENRIDNTHYKQGSFNKIFCLNSLHHFKDPGDFIGKCFNLLKRNGLLIVIDFDRSYISMSLAEIIFKFNQTHARSYRREETEGLLVENGFKIKKAVSEKPGLFWGYYGIVGEKI